MLAIYRSSHAARRRLRHRSRCTTASSKTSRCILSTRRYVQKRRRGPSRPRPALRPHRVRLPWRPRRVYRARARRPSLSAAWPHSTTPCRVRPLALDVCEEISDMGDLERRPVYALRTQTNAAPGARARRRARSRPERDTSRCALAAPEDAGQAVHDSSPRRRRVVARV